MDEIINTELVSVFFAVIGLIMASILFFKLEVLASIQLLGTILIVAISFSAHNAAVYLISVFVIATLVTELHFLEKIAALIWNRKEYWNYLAEKATKAEVESKTKQEIASEILENESAEPDDIEPVVDTDSTPTGILDTSNEPALNTGELINRALIFEKDVFQALKKQIPFSYKKLNHDVSISAGARKYLFDIIIETTSIHYLVEVKYYSKAYSLQNAAKQLKHNTQIYRKYLRERNLKCAVQPLIIVPKSLNSQESVSEIPIIKFDIDENKFIGLRKEYPSYSLSDEKLSPQLLSKTLTQFLRTYSTWAFSPLRIQRWGSKQPNFEVLNMFSTNDIRSELEVLLSKGIVTESVSKKGNKLYRINN